MSIYWVGLVVVVAAFILSFFLKAAPLREKSALQENADDEAALLAQNAAAATGALVAPGAADAADDSDDSDDKGSATDVRSGKPDS